MQPSPGEDTMVDETVDIIWSNVVVWEALPKSWKSVMHEAELWSTLSSETVVVCIGDYEISKSNFWNFEIEFETETSPPPWDEPWGFNPLDDEEEGVAPRLEGGT
jgi:hypothetical protein